jgi:hypothetical protein
VRRIYALTLAFASSVSGCPRPPSPHADAAPAVVRPRPVEVAVVIYDGGLQNGWQDWGWAPKETPPKAPARVRFDNYGGWMLAKVGLTGDYGGVVFRVKEPPGEGEFLEVHLLSPTGTTLPQVKVIPDDRLDVGEGWTEIFVPIERLDPDNVPFDRVVIQSFRPFSADYVPVDKIGLAKGTPRQPVASVDPKKVARVSVSIDCRAKATRISPLIYGIAYYAADDAKKQQAQWQLGATARRWGGNTTSVYNWEASLWNLGNDWFFEDKSVPSHTQFLQDNVAHGMKTALTVPMLGWVAKDASSLSFPVPVFGPQDATDPYKPEAGNGKQKGGKLLVPGSPARAYQPITPAWVKRWIETIRKEDAKTGRRSVDMYILDNEPMLWNTTHRDAHPEPTSYDELVQRTIDYGTVIREADPDAVIAGPAEWGWTGYMYSAKDMASGGTTLRLDRRAHGDVPVVAYYLKALADHEKKTGTRVLDVLDLHDYPQAQGVFGSAADNKVAALRIRSTRMLWDPVYVDESWVNEPVKLLPRMREWIDQNYPGRGLSIGEWNFGGEEHMSGALATAEAFGRFAQFGVNSAFYWTYPPENSPTGWAFRAYRNYDAKGGHFLDWFTPAKLSPAGEYSVFASRDDSGGRLVMIALNFSRDQAIAADLDVASCGKPESLKSYTYQGGTAGLVAGGVSTPPPSQVVLAPYSLTVLDVQLQDATPVVH